MRFLLTIPPLSLSATEAKRFSGHSLRHLLPTLARLFGLSQEDREELARWAASPDKRGQRRSMPNVYAQEVEMPRVVDIITKLLSRAFARSDEIGGFDALPAFGGWDAFLPVPGFVPNDALPDEASSSESDLSDTETITL